ncbi:hypothetical protein KC717_07095, partial [Candidatus Dojkabacteria bacterium]|nr:hypothetical protein [Candidatus Dojkabacteria bacterium]
ITQLALDGKIPHYRLMAEDEDEVLLFDNSELLDTLDINLEAVFPQVLTIQTTSVPIDSEDKIPYSISQIKELRKPLYLSETIGSCIYFLCEGDEVVYIGQSVSLMSRLESHRVDKKFNRVYLLQVPSNHLNRVEAEFIRTLQPRLNKQLYVTHNQSKSKVLL